MVANHIIQGKIYCKILWQKEIPFRKGLKYFEMNFSLNVSETCIFRDLIKFL